MKYLKTSQLIHPTGKRAFAALMTAAMATTGVAVVASPISQAVPAPPSGENFFGKKPKNPGSGIGKLTINDKVAPGGILTVKGEGMAKRDAAGQVDFMLNDGTGELNWPDQTENDGVNVEKPGGRTVTFLVKNWTDETSFTAKMRLPEEIKPGFYWLRMNAGNDGGSRASRIEWFEVSNDAGVEQGKVDLKAEDVSSTGVSISGKGLSSTSELTATVNDKSVQFVVGKRQYADTIKPNKDGVLDTKLKFAAGTVPAGTEGTVKLKAADKVVGEGKFTGVTSTNFAAKGRDGQAGSGTAVGGESQITVTNLAADAEVTFLGAGDANWLGSPVKAKDGAAVLNVKIPEDAKLGDQIVVKYTTGGSTHSEETGGRVTAAEKIVNADKFDIKKQSLPTGLYQSAYYKKENVIFVTASDGRPPVTDTKLYKLDADSLKKKGEVVPAVQDSATGNRWAVYGVAVDEKHDRVWVTNTRLDTVAVYDAKTLKLIHQFEKGTLSHPRGILVLDNGDAVVAAPFTDKLGYYSLGEDGKSPIFASYGIDLDGASELKQDPATGLIYTSNISNGQVAVIDPKDYNFTVVDKIDLGSEMAGTTDVAWDSDHKQLFVTGQETSNVAVVDMTTKKIKKIIPIGARALGIAYDPKNKVALAVSREGGTGTVIDAKTLETKAVLDFGRFPNHVSADGRGNFYVTNKAGQRLDAVKDDQIFKVSLKGKAGNGLGSSSGSSGSDSSGSNSGQNTGSSGAMGSILGGLIGIIAGVGVLAGLLGAAKFALDHKMVNPAMLPKPLRELLKLR